jgi:hypothetical protein
LSTKSITTVTTPRRLPSTRHFRGSTEPGTGQPSCGARMATFVRSTHGDPRAGGPCVALPADSLGTARRVHTSGHEGETGSGELAEGQTMGAHGSKQLSLNSDNPQLQVSVYDSSSPLPRPGERPARHPSPAADPSTHGGRRAEHACMAAVLRGYRVGSTDPPADA